MNSKAIFLISLVSSTVINSAGYILILYYFAFVFKHNCQFEMYKMIFIPSTWFVLFSSTYTANKLANFIYFVVFKSRHTNLESANPFNGYLIFFMWVFLFFALFLAWDTPTLGPPELCNLAGQGL